MRNINFNFTLNDTTKLKIGDELDFFSQDFTKIERIVIVQIKDFRVKAYTKYHKQLGTRWYSIKFCNQVFPSQKSLGAGDRHNKAKSKARKK